MEIILLVGRVLFALLFINSGVAHITKLQAMTGYAQFKKVPAPKVAVLLTGLMLIVGALLVAVGYYADLGALILAIFLIPAAFMMHNFWTIEDAQAKQGETINFFKNLSLAGAALVIFVMIATGGADLNIGPSLGDANWFDFKL